MEGTRARRLKHRGGGQPVRGLVSGRLEPRHALPGLQLYQQYVELLTNRVNTVNGRTYKADPTIW
jgi:hypothetical protein